MCRALVIRRLEVPSAYSFVTLAFATFLIATSLPLVATDVPPLVGARVGVEVTSESTYPTSLVPEIFARFFPASSVAVEVGLGYRYNKYYYGGGAYGNDYSITQVPLTIGAHFVPAATGAFSTSLGVGIHVALTRDAYSTYSGYPPPARYSSGERTLVVLGAFGQLGIQVSLGRALFGDLTARYVINPVTSGIGYPQNQDYCRVQLGLGAKL